MKLKNSLIKYIQNMLSFFGVEAFLKRKDKNTNYTLINLNYMSRYYSGCEFISLYTNAQSLTKSENRDSFEKQIRYYGIYQMVKYVLNRNILGDFAECGCWRGHSSYLISKIISDNGSDKKFLIFDSFEGGLSDKRDEDKDLLANVDPTDINKEKNAFYSTENEVKNNLSEFNFVSLHKGWIPSEFKYFEDRKFSFVNLDLDLYEPILDSLLFFYPRLSDSGIIIIDDYATTDWPGVKKAVDEFLKSYKPKFKIETIGSLIIMK
jgi:hypothetical protein